MDFACIWYIWLLTIVYMRNCCVSSVRMTSWANDNYMPNGRSKYIWYVTSCHPLTHFSQSKIVYNCIFYVSLLDLYFQFIQRGKTPTRAFCPMRWTFYPIGGIKRPFLWKNKKVVFFINIDNKPFKLVLLIANDHCLCFVHIWVNLWHWFLKYEAKSLRGRLAPPYLIPISSTV